MSEKAATGAKRARANTDGEIYEEEQKKLVQKIYKLKKVIKILADTQLQYIKYFESADGKLDKIHEENVKLHAENTEIKELVQMLLHNITKNENTIKMVQSQTAKTADLLRKATLQNVQQQQPMQQQQQQQQQGQPQQQQEQQAQPQKPQSWTQVVKKNANKNVEPTKRLTQQEQKRITWNDRRILIPRTDASAAKTDVINIRNTIN